MAKTTGNNKGPLTVLLFHGGECSRIGLVSFSGQGATDQGEGAQGSAAV